MTGERNRQIDRGPLIVKSEVERALRAMKTMKATGLDEISVEIMKVLDDFSHGELTELCNYIYNIGHIPDDLKKSVLITLPQKTKAVECSDFRTIILMIKHIRST